MKEKYNLKDSLSLADSLYTNDRSIEGKGMLTTPQYINSMRSVMFASHLNQFKNQIQPDFAQFFTAGENVVGKYSDGYMKFDDSIVYRKIVKFEGLVENPTVYTLFLYNNKRKRFEVVTRKPDEDLVEVFGYRYNNEVIDSFEEGDHIDEGTIGYKSTSYDENMNYSYGRDLITQLTFDPFTTEDAAIISEEVVDLVKNIEVEENIATLNDNDFPLNIYGDELEYKTFPDIGEFSNGIIMAVRRKFNNQVLFDFKEDMLSKVTDTDTKFFIEGKVVDVEIFCNNEDFADSSFYHQIYNYWCYQNAYFREIKETCEDIFDSGEEFSSDIDYLYKRACYMLDLTKRWKEKDSAFSGVQVHILVERETPLEVGQKISGRYGNKSVISHIRKKEDMPFFYDSNGKKVHVQLQLSVLAVINRTTAAVLMELETNFIGRRVSEFLVRCKTMKEKEKILFDVLTIFNEDYSKYIKKKYNEKTTEEKREFLRYCEEKKIHFNQPSMGEKEPIFYRLMELNQKYSDILEPDKMYIHKFGRDIPCIMTSRIANMYIITLKQTAKKGFSVRGIGAVSAKGIPERSYKSKSHKDLYSSTAIRFGEFETLNFCIAMMPEEVALVHAFYRTSVKARKDFGKALINNEPIISVPKTYDSRVAEFFEIILKSLGFELEFLDSDDDLVELSLDEMEWYPLENGKSIICSPYDKYIIDRRNEIGQEILEEYGALNTDELNEMIDDEIQDREYFIGRYDGSDDFYKNCTDVEVPLSMLNPVSSEEIIHQLSGSIDEVVD